MSPERIRDNMLMYKWQHDPHYFSKDENAADLRRLLELEDFHAHTELVGRPPLNHMITAGKLNAVKIMMEEGKIRASTKHSMQQSLALACFTQNMDIVKYLVEEQKCELPVFPLDCIDTLTELARKGATEVLRYLRKKNMFFTSHIQRSTETTSILRAACIRGHLETVRFLVEEMGADVREEAWSRFGDPVSLVTYVRDKAQSGRYTGEFEHALLLEQVLDYLLRRQRYEQIAALAHADVTPQPDTCAASRSFTRNKLFDKNLLLMIARYIS